MLLQNLEETGTIFVGRGNHTQKQTNKQNKQNKNFGEVFSNTVFKLVKTIVHFTVVCLVTWPLSRSEAGGDLVLIQTSCFSYVNAN